jgi:hypothetical protein
LVIELVLYGDPHCPYGVLVEPTPSRDPGRRKGFRRESGSTGLPLGFAGLPLGFARLPLGFARY